MASGTRISASGTSVPRTFEFSRSAESKHILDEDWDDAYYASESWAEEWVVTQDPDRLDRPLGIKHFEHKMYLYEKLCVPENVTVVSFARITPRLVMSEGKIVERNADMVSLHAR